MSTGGTLGPANANQSPAITDADVPFNKVKADVILRSADNVDFRFFKLLLSLASSFFDDMFTLPQAPKGHDSNERKDGLPVVQVTEEKKTLEMLLLMCYPMSVIDPPDLETLNEVHLLLDAAIKYNMERVEKRVRGWLVAPRFLDIDPVRVFAIACHHRLKAEAELAAGATCFMPLLQRPYGPELEFITGGQLYQLLQYHENCLEPVKKIATDFTWIEQTSFCWFNCIYCGGRYEKVGPNGQNLRVDNWWYNYMQAVAGALNNRAWDEAKINDLMETALKSAHMNCGPGDGIAWRARAQLPEFRDIMRAKIKEVVSQAPLDLHF